MTEQEFYEYMKHDDNAERVIVGLDIATWHMTLEVVFSECIKCGRYKDVEAMKFIIDNNIHTNMFAKIGEYK